ncbi:MAG: hypothetical protein V1664_02510 [Candidatus Uhrbacteria bacterium]
MIIFFTEGEIRTSPAIANADAQGRRFRQAVVVQNGWPIPAAVSMIAVCPEATTVIFEQVVERDNWIALSISWIPPPGHWAPCTPQPERIAACSILRTTLLGLREWCGVSFWENFVLLLFY